MSSIETRLEAAGLPPLPRTAWLEIDLDALRGNLAALRSLAGTGVPVHPVVKADAYGHGAVPVALALEAAGADGFCVAALDEALALRAGGIRGPIRVLYPIPVALAAEAARQRVTVSGGDPDQLAALLEATQITEATDAAEPLDIELEVETGLGRGGFAPEALAAAASAITDAPHTRLAGLWTHLQASEDPDRTRDAAGALRRRDGAPARSGVAGAPTACRGQWRAVHGRGGPRRRPAGPRGLRDRARRARRARA